MRCRSGITIHALTGDDITEDAWDAFFAFYMRRFAEMGRPYLTRTFFSLISRAWRKTCCWYGPAQRPLDRRRHHSSAATLVRPQLGRDRASSVPAFRGLYYQAIDFGSGGPENRRGRGASEHKIARGYLPQPLLRALHRGPGLRHAISDYLKREVPMWRSRTRTDRAGPFRKTDE